MHNISQTNAQKVTTEKIYNLYLDQIKSKQYSAAKETSHTLSRIDNSGIGEFTYALLLHHGLGVEKDLYDAREWYKKAADKGGASTAMYNYANMLRNGEGGPKDVEGAREWYKKAADKCDAAAMFYYALMLLAEDSKSLDARLYINKGKKAVSIINFLKNELTFSLCETSFFSALVSELASSELDQLLESNIMPIHKVWLREQKKISKNVQAVVTTPTASAAAVSVFATMPAVTELLSNVKNLISFSANDANNSSRMLNIALDILRGIDKTKLDANLYGKYSKLLNKIKEINPPCSLNNAMFIDSTRSGDEERREVKRIKIELE